MNRSQRRAAARQTAVSDAQLNANRQNAQKSSGPRTPEGRKKSSMNAVKTGLTSRKVLLTEEDAVFYQQHLNRHFEEFSPATDREKVLVQSIADAEWRIHSIVPLEASLYAIGRKDLAPLVEEEQDPDTRERELVGRIYEKYRRDFQNLALQERRLRNHKKTDTAELLALQLARQEKAQEAVRKRDAEIQRAIEIANRCLKFQRVFDPRAHGFDFSFEEYRHWGRLNQGQYDITRTNLDFDTVVNAYRAAQQEQKVA